MTVLGLGLALLVGMLLVHVLRWKISLPQNQLAALLKLILAVAALWLALNLGLGLAEVSLGPLPLAPVPCVLVLFFYLALSLGYVMLFSTIDADSPSITILLALHAAGEQGVTAEELARRTGMDRFFASRIERMLADRMIAPADGGFVPAPKGLFLLRLVGLWRVVMGAPADLG
ncbi:MAG: hypothetical protein Q7U56_13925 [Humidesulfovibrio sp.]|nr:hypothetical protein [Humidesulfovibrio sp.]